MTLTEQLSHALSPDNPETDETSNSDEDNDDNVRRDAFEGLPPRMIESFFRRVISQSTD